MSNENPHDLATSGEPWRRLWLPAATWDQHRNIDDDLFSDHGTPDGIDHIWEDPLKGIGPLKDYASIPFLMLLGRPGAGKSHELQAARAQHWLGQDAVLVEAKEIGLANPGDYLDGLVALDSSRRLIIDGLDEALLQNPNFVAQLKAWFRRHLDDEGRPRHFLAISCRWSDWPESQVEELAALWSSQNSECLVLCPLRRSDVVETLRRRFGDRSEVFWQQMRDLHLRHVACWPQGLLGMMNQFDDSGFQTLADSHARAIEDQVVRECRLAESPNHPLRWQQSAKDVEWRRRIAGRVAAAMIWSGKAQLDLTATSSISEAVTIQDLACTEELWEGRRTAVNLSDIDGLVHRSSLLKRMTRADRWVFQSQVQQEWLAADWLVAQNLDTGRLRQMFGIAEDDRWLVFPTLKTVAAWLARYDRQFRKLVLRHDPLVLLRMDGASLPEAERKEIVGALLSATDAIRVIDLGTRQAHLPSLRHPKLLDQLTKWLKDQNACDAAKELALEIAEKTQLTNLSGLLWNLYPGTTGRLQIAMAGALYRLARQGFDDQWNAVLRSEIPIDSHGTLLGAALEIMVADSKKVPVRDVIDWLIPERSFEVWGIYKTVASGLHKRLTTKDLPAVFAKLGEHPALIHDSIPLRDFNDAAVLLAIDQFGCPEVASALTDFWHTCLRHHTKPHHRHNENWDTESLGLKSDRRRREIILALITHPAFDTNTERKWIFPGDYLFLEKDFEWCLDQLLTAEPADHWRFAMVVGSYIWRADLDEGVARKLDAARSASPALKEILPEPLPNEDIRSAIARIANEQQTRRKHDGKKWKRKQARRDHRFREDLLRFTSRCREDHDRGELVWPGVEQILGTRAHGSGSRTVTFAPISGIGPDEPWMNEAAERYLIECPQRHELNEDHGLYGLLALAACPPVLDHDGAVRRSIEKHWLPLFINLLNTDSLGNPPLGISIQRLAECFPNTFAAAAVQVYRDQYRDKGSLSELHSFHACWSPEMTTQLSTMLQEEELHAEGFFNGVRFLSRHNEDVAIDVVLHWLEWLDDDAPRAAKAAVVGAAATLLGGRLASEVDPYLQDNDLVADTIRTLAHRLGFHDTRMDFDGWPDQAVKALAEACWRAFPRLDRRRGHRGGFHTVTTEDEAIEFRDHVTATARNRGIEIEIAETHPDDDHEEANQRRHSIDWNRHAAAQARTNKEWKPVDAATFFQLASRPTAHLARNNNELMDAVIECLRRWEKTLAAGEWDHLWDIKSRSSRPEKRIARELRDRLYAELDVIVEREVELGSERRTDIIVQTNPNEPSASRLTIVIELKKYRKSNAKERRTRMKTQLLERYLHERQHEGWTHGLYVVAWTPEPGSKDDNHQAIAAHQAALDHQAECLSTPAFTLKAMVIDARYRGGSG